MNKKAIKRAVATADNLVGSLLEKCGGPGSGIPGPCPTGHSSGGGVNHAAESEKVAYHSDKKHKEIAGQALAAAKKSGDKKGVVWIDHSRHEVSITGGKGLLIPKFQGNKLDARAIGQHMQNSGSIQMSMVSGKPSRTSGTGVMQTDEGPYVPGVGFVDV